jgi:hypothetical protein
MPIQAQRLPAMGAVEGHSAPLIEQYQNFLILPLRLSASLSRLPAL